MSIDEPSIEQQEQESSTSRILKSDSSTIEQSIECRVIASPNTKIPSLERSSERLDFTDKIGAIYQAYNNRQLQQRENDDISIELLKESLHQAGYQLLSQRDLDLCKALNQGYLLRLSIAPELQFCEPNLYLEFYNDGADKALLDGRVLIFKRGYSQEITNGRLILPKLDYLQSSLVQRSAAKVVKEISKIEKSLSDSISEKYDKLQNRLQDALDGWKESIPDQVSLLNVVEDTLDNMVLNETLSTKKLTGLDISNVTESVKQKMNVNITLKEPLAKQIDLIKNATKATRSNLNKTKMVKFKLERYAGEAQYAYRNSNGQISMEDIDETDALAPFMVCEVEPSNLEEGGISSLSCQYDLDKRASTIQQDLSAPSYRLKRVSIANLVGLFSEGGRRRLIKRLFAISELVEPTYEDVVVIWRPLQPPEKKKVDFSIKPPKFVYDVFEIFAIEDKLPKPPEPEPEPEPLPLEIRTFSGVPMANLLAVLPETKLILRPADALIFDAVNVFSLIAVLASQKFDNPKLDFIALVSVSLWFLRSFFRYSNKIARYDLVVNKFLTQKLSNRNKGALKYIVGESAIQRARRTSLLHEWLLIETRDGIYPSRDEILEVGSIFLNEILGLEEPIFLDIEQAIDDLIELNLIEFNGEGELIQVLSEEESILPLKSIWNTLF